MSTKTELTEAHRAMAAVLDAKFAHSAEWKAFRAIDRALIAIVESESAGISPNGADAPRQRRRKGGQQLSYTEFTEKALEETGGPIATGPLIEFIRQNRELGQDLKKATINITSTLSKSSKFRNIPWEGGRAWWYADRPIPLKKTAGA